MTDKIDDIKPEDKEKMLRVLMMPHGIDEFFHGLRQNNKKQLDQFDGLIKLAKQRNDTLLGSLLTLTQYPFAEIAQLYTIIQLSLLVQAKLKEEMLQILDGFLSDDKSRLEDLDKLLLRYQNDPLTTNEQKHLFESIRKGLAKRSQ